MGSANQSLPHIEPVSGRPKRKLENGEQRLARENHRCWTESVQIAGQRLGPASLTHRNVGGSPTPGNHYEETGLAGWGARIRTWEWRNQNPLPYHLARPRFMFTAQVYLRAGARRRGGPWMPKRILMTHPPDQRPQVRIDLRPTSKWVRCAWRP